MGVCQVIPVLFSFHSQDSPSYSQNQICLIMNEPLQQIIFVYGTLRQGGSNAFRMDGAMFLADAYTTGRLYRIDWYPGAIFDHNAGTSIIGELYQVTEKHLRELDAFEGEEYRRVNILVITENGSMDAWAWEYQRSVEQQTQMMTGDWLKEYHP